MKNLIKKINVWLRNLILDDVDKDIKDPLPYHKKFGSKKNPTERIERRFNEQRRNNEFY